MKNIIGNIIILIGLVLGIYLGGVVLLYGGIMQIINNTCGQDIAIGIIRILFTSLGFYIPFIAGYCIGTSIKYN